MKLLTELKPNTLITRNLRASEKIGQGIQEWTKQNLWTTAFKKKLAKAGHMTLNYLKAVFHKFYLIHSRIP